MLELGSLVDGKYKVLNKIGQGGMSIVYLAMNERANKQWAIKEVRKDGIQNFEVVKQGLLVETDLLKKLSHPNLPSIVDVIDGDGSFLIVMDYIEGHPLERVLRESGPQKQEEVIEWAKQLCDVLEYLHSRKPPIIYRDMKPSNIMLRPDGKVMLIDFGTAREFKETSLSDTTCLGTQGYAAPEQYGGCGQTDSRTDIYCLGATLYHLLTGHNPSKPPYEMYPIRHWNPELSSGLEEIILKCTQKNPQDRYQSCDELLYALEHYRELDLEYRKKQTLKWRSFLVTATIAVLTGFGAVGFKMAEHFARANTYEAYVTEAENLSSIDWDKCVEYYENAIALNPKEGAAYEGILKYFLLYDKENKEYGEGDQVTVFSSEEEQIIRKVMGISEDGKKSNEDYFRGNSRAYCEFSYNLGIAYFYSYNGTGDKAASKKWLKNVTTAEKSRSLSEKKRSRAKNLYKIASYYDSLKVRNQAGDSVISYLDYWNDLVDIVEEDGRGSNNLYKLFSYKELTAQLVARASSFKDAGVTKRQMTIQLEKAENMLQSMKLNEKYEVDMRNIIYEQVRMAKDIVESVYNTLNIEESVRR